MGVVSGGAVGAVHLQLVEQGAQHLVGAGDRDARAAGVEAGLADVHLGDLVVAAGIEDGVQDLRQQQRIDDVTGDLDGLGCFGRHALSSRASPRVRFRVRSGGRDIMPPAMGQPITVVERPSATPGIARFETNRSLTGMGHERYGSVDDILDDRPVDELARRLFDSGGVTQVHANGNMVTVHLADGWTGERLLDVIRGLYIHYPSTAAPGETSAEAPVDDQVTGAGGPATPGDGKGNGSDRPPPDEAQVGEADAVPAESEAQG
jgi:hypothetical protein